MPTKQERRAERKKAEEEAQRQARLAKFGATNSEQGQTPVPLPGLSTGQPARPPAGMAKDTVAPTTQGPAPSSPPGVASKAVAPAHGVPTRPIAAPTAPQRTASAQAVAQVSDADAEFSAELAEEAVGAILPPVPGSGASLHALVARVNGALVGLEDAKKRADDRDESAKAARTVAEQRARTLNERIVRFDAVLNKLGEMAGGLPTEPPVIDTPASEEDILRKAVAAATAFIAAKAAADAAERAARQGFADNEKQRKQIEEDRSQVRSERTAFEAEVRLAAKASAGRNREQDERETSLMARDERITERERGAEDNFLAVRRRVMGNLEEHAERLRTECSDLQHTLDRHRDEAETEWRKTIDERRETTLREGAERAREREEASRTEEAEHQALRERRLGDLAEELERKRNEAEAALEHERAEVREQRRAALRLRRRREVHLDILKERKAGLDDEVKQRAARDVSGLQEELRAEQERLQVAESDRNRYFAELEAHRGLERRLEGREPAALLDQLRTLEKQKADLEERLRQRPSAASAARLAELEERAESWQEDERVLRAHLAEERSRVSMLRVGALEIERAKDEKEAHEARIELLKQQLDTLKAEVLDYKQAAANKSPLEELARFDKEIWRDPVKTVAIPVASGSPFLKGFVLDMQQRLANALPDRTLYYDLRDIRCFLGGLATSPLLLLQGRSGTGKTSLPLAFKEAMGAELVKVSVQAGWRDRQDLLGYYNAFHRHFYASDFLQALYQAGTGRCKDRPFFIVLDEINLSRVEQFFADFLSSLEFAPNERIVTLLSQPIDGAERLVDGRQLRIPPNVWFIGTANHDETTTGFAPKTYDRAHVLDLQKRGEAFDLHRPRHRDPISLASLQDAFKNAAERRKPEVAAVRDWLKADGELSKFFKRRFRLGWGNRLDRDVERFLPVVVEADGTVGEAVDHLLATKVLRTLRGRFDISESAFEQLKENLHRLWKFDGPLTACDELIDDAIQDKRDEAGAS